MKSKKTKCLIISSLALLIVGGFTTSSYALPKTSINTNTEIKSEKYTELIKEISFSNEVVSVGDTLKISIVPNSNINNVKKMFLSYNISGDIKSPIELFYNSNSKKFEATLNITTDMEQSTLHFFDLKLINNNGNEIYGVFNEKFVWVKDKDGEVDKIAPEVKNITIDKPIAFVGEKITISAEASDNKSGIKQFLIEYNTTTGNIFNTLELKYNPSTKKFEGTINVVDDMVNNMIFLKSFSITDNQGNDLYDSVGAVGDSNFFVLTENNIGWNNINNDWIYLNKDKTLYKGWLKHSNNWYFMNSAGLMITGWESINGSQYYFNENGAMESNKWIDDFYVGESGATCYNQWIGDYYCGSNGEYIKNQWAGDYYCGADGKYVKSQWAGDYYCGIDGKYVKNQWIGDYYCGTDGKYVKNQWIGDYYCGADGKYVKNSWVKTNGKWYYCSNTGQYLKNTSINLNNKTYQFNANGVCLNP